jgi:hypothetical protein
MHSLRLIPKQFTCKQISPFSFFSCLTARACDTQLKEFYTTADAKNVELSRELQAANELLRAARREAAEREAAGAAALAEARARGAADADAGRREAAELRARLESAERTGRGAESDAKQAAVRLQLAQQVRCGAVGGPRFACSGGGLRLLSLETCVV